jgi:hypothetical protein
LRASNIAILLSVGLRARGGIWWYLEGIIHYKLFERNLAVIAEGYCQQLEKAIQQKRPGLTTWGDYSA